MNAPLQQATPGFDVKRVACREKPLIGVSLVERLLLRHVDHVSPEARLCVAVIKQAFVDLCGPSNEARRDARRFFRDGRLELWCEQVGLSPEFLQEIAVKTGYLPADAATKEGRHA
jgi:hypothetical protein